MTTLSWPEVRTELSGLCNLATADHTGAPHVAVVAPLVDETEIWVFTNRSSKKARNLAENPRIALMWRPGNEHYVYGTAELIDDMDTKERLWDSPLLSFDPTAFFGAATNPEFLVVKVTPDHGVVLTRSGSQRWTHPST